MNQRLPLSVALLWIFLSTFLITGSTYSLLTIYKRHSTKTSHLYSIRKIVQTGLQRDMLPCSAIAEMLDLSQDRPTPIHEFSIEEAKKKLRSFPMIKEATLFVIKPDTVYIEYSMREPIALLYDYENIAIDEEGYLFPLTPFYSPKKLPYIYFGTSCPDLNEEMAILPKNTWSFALQLLRTLKKVAQEEDVICKRIDVSRAFSSSLGRQEVIVELICEDTFHYLRLSPKDYAIGLGNYSVLHDTLLSSEKKVRERIIDLRIHSSAFIKENI